MWKWICALLLSPLLLPVYATAEPAPDGQAGSWFTYFYLWDNPDQSAAAVLENLSINGILRKPNAVASLEGFFAEVFQNKPERAERWIATSGMTGDDAIPLLRGLWLSGHSELAERLARELGVAEPQAFRTEAPALSAIPVSAPADLDRLWGAFSASGNTNYLRPILAVLSRPEPAGEKTPDLRLKNAASWSLGSNELQHTLVARFLAAEQQKLSAPALEWLDRERNRRTPKPCIQACDGPFSAVMLPTTDLEFYSRWQTMGHNEAPQVSTVNQAKVGDVVAVPIVFSGFEQRENLEADVTYDIVVTAPDGTVYGKGDRLEALKGKAATNRFVLLAVQDMRIRFEPGDPLGEYRIDAQITDNVSGRRLTLGQKVNLD